MPDQGVATWNGLVVQEYAKMTRSKGVQRTRARSCSRAALRSRSMPMGYWRSGTAARRSTSSRTVALVLQRTQPPDGSSGGTRSAIDAGSGSSRGSTKVTTSETMTIRSCPGRQRMRENSHSLLLQKLGETGFDVSAMPTDAQLAPPIEWDFTPAAKQLQDLVSMFGCDVHLLPNDTVAILREGTGSLSPSTGLTTDPEVGLSISDAPDKVGAYAGSTQFESWLELEPIMYEYPDGKVVLLEDSTLKPSGAGARATSTPVWPWPPPRRT